MTFHGSYAPEDVTILLKPANIKFTNIEEKEELLQSGKKHYSEMLSPEVVPDETYLALYDDALQRNAARLKADIEQLADDILDITGGNPIIVSLARAGTPIGVLLQREIRARGIESFHYSVSIIRGRGIDQKALGEIVARHGTDGIIFVDGWTGKGAITTELQASLAGTKVEPRLAVVADPAGCATIAATVDDYVIPSGILNGIVSGLISRSVLNEDVVGDEDYHACLHQVDLAEHDRSINFIEAIEAAVSCRKGTPATSSSQKAAKIAASEIIGKIQTENQVDDINRIKPGIAEATRAILRRVPDALYVRDKNSKDVKHIVLLAEQAGIPINTLPKDCPYGAITVIKKVAE